MPQLYFVFPKPRDPVTNAWEYVPRAGECVEMGSDVYKVLAIERTLRSYGADSEPRIKVYCGWWKRP